VDVKLQPDGKTVTGYWGKQLSTLTASPGGEFAQEYANWPDDPESILRWIRKHGPLSYPPVHMGMSELAKKMKEIESQGGSSISIPEIRRIFAARNILGGWALGLQSDGDEFLSFTLARWRQDQINIRSEWEARCGIGPDANFFKKYDEAIVTHRMSPTDGLSVQRGRVVSVEVSDLRHFLEIELDMIVDRLRVCPNPGCKGNKYFVAVHGRQQLCSPACLGWSRKQAQTRYWHSDKAKQRRKQKT
jgi:hypothetical protein